jgi:hypothetical protein
MHESLADGQQSPRMSWIKLGLLAVLRDCDAPTGLVDPSDQHDLGVIACTGADVRPAISGLHAGLRCSIDAGDRASHV